MKDNFIVQYVGLVNYKKALDLQMLALEDIKADLYKSKLLLLEHPEVITIGSKKGSENNLIKINKGVDLVYTDRGGDITYHCPGQLIGYPITDLSLFNNDAHFFIRTLESVLIEVLDKYNIKANVKNNYTGVWVADKKIASIGIGVKQRISYHGFALNVNNSIEGFNMIIPCGLNGVKMTSMKLELGKHVEFEQNTKKGLNSLLNDIDMNQLIDFIKDLWLNRLAKTQKDLL